MTRLRACVALLAVLLGTLTVATGSPASAATGKPKVGQCHNLTFKNVTLPREPKPPVPCGARHTTQTIAVVTVSTPLKGLSLDQLATIGAQACVPPTLKALGRNAVARLATAYDLFYFMPTKPLIAAGAQWFRCDIGVLADKSMLPIQRLSKPIVPRILKDADLRCIAKDHMPTPCSHPHAYRPNRALTFKANVTSPPTKADVPYLLANVCPKGSRYVIWNDAQWAAGDRAIVCYAKTTT